MTTKCDLEQTFSQLILSGKPVALIDLDGVIIDNNHRLPHISHAVDGKQAPRQDADWAAFHAAAHLDTPGIFVPVVRRMIMYGMYTPIFLSARIEVEYGTHASILKQVREALGAHIPHWSLLLRPQGSTEPAPEFKGRIIDMLLERKVQIDLAVDDSHANCLQFKARGIPTLRMYNHLPEDGYHY